MSPKAVESTRGTPGRHSTQGKRFRALSFGEAVGVYAESYVEPSLLVAEEELEEGRVNDRIARPSNRATRGSPPSRRGRLARLLSLPRGPNR